MGLGRSELIGAKRIMIRMTVSHISLKIGIHAGFVAGVDFLERQ